MRRWHWIVLGLIVLSAGAPRFYRLDSTAVWCDELLSIHISNAHNFAVDQLPRDVLITDVPDLMTLANAQPAWKVWGTMGGDQHPPLYYQLLRFWREIFGDSPAGIRSLSAVIGTLSLVFIFFAGRELVGTTGGLWASAMNAVAANHIYFSQEARMYIFALALTTAAMGLVLRIDRLGFNRRRGIGLAAVSAAAMLTLYLSAAVLLATAIYALIRFRGRKLAMTFVSYVGGALLFAILWLPFFHQDFAAMNSPWLNASPSGHVGRTLNLLLLLPMNHFAVPLPNGDNYGYAIASIYLLPRLFVRKCPAILLPWMAMVIVAAFPAVTDLARTTGMLMWPRFTLLMLPGLALSFVAISWQLPRFRWLLPAGLVIFSTVSLPATYQLPRMDFRHHAKVAEQASLAGEGRLVLATTFCPKFNSALLLSMQYYWKAMPREMVLVESVEAIDRLPRDVIPDQIILAAGDLPADLSKLTDWDVTGHQTWDRGVGSVHSLRRRPTSNPSAPEERR